MNLGELVGADADNRLSNAVDINDRGQIFGFTARFLGAPPTYAFLWTVSPLWGYPDDL